jgi:hypothetical protein
MNYWYGQVKRYILCMARELNVPVTVRQVPGGVIFWRTSQEDQQQSQETANRLQTAQQRPQARPRGRRRG